METPRRKASHEKKIGQCTARRRCSPERVPGGHARSACRPRQLRNRLGHGQQGLRQLQHRHRPVPTRHPVQELGHRLAPVQRLGERRRGHLRGLPIRLRRVVGHPGRPADPRREAQLSFNRASGSTPEKPAPWWCLREQAPPLPQQPHNTKSSPPQAESF